MLGIKFLIISDPNQQNLETLAIEIYELYIDLLKNPFYELDQPINNTCDKFHFNLESKIECINVKCLTNVSNKKI